MTGLQNKNIIITGASSGIGRQIAIEASKCGANILMIARSTQRLEQTYRMLAAGNHAFFPYDLSQPGSCDILIDEIVTRYGPVFGFVHSAGIEATIPFTNMKAETYENLFRVNVIAGFEIARLISKKKNSHPEGGSYVFLSSVMGKLGKEGKVAYCASKAALLGGVKAMSMELGSRKIRCNTVLPGMVETEMSKQMFESLPESSVAEIVRQHPLGLGTPVDIAYLAVFLLSDQSRWITGSEIVIDGGYSAG